MVNFGYPYNDLVICKDSTDYLNFHQEIEIFSKRNYANSGGHLKIVSEIKKHKIVYIRPYNFNK